MLNLTARMLARSTDTSDTSVVAAEVSAFSLPLLGCTPDTFDTSENGEPVTTVSDSVAIGAECLATMPSLGTAVPGVVGYVRVALFLTHHVPATEAVQLAARLSRRDRERDERRLCLECAHLSGAADARRCANWRATGMRGNTIPAELVSMLQRCAGFAECAGLAPMSWAVPLEEWMAGSVPCAEDGDE
jgi:hypothetical protein